MARNSYSSGNDFGNGGGEGKGSVGGTKGLIPTGEIREGRDNELFTN